MDMREEIRIGCSILMVGAALATLSSLTGLGFIERVDLTQTLVVGTFVLAMIVAAARVLVSGDRASSAIAVAAGAATAISGAYLVGHQFLWAFPSFYVIGALASLTVARPAKSARLTGR